MRRGRTSASIPSLIAAPTIVTALNAIVSRNLDPLDSGVISICMFHSGEALNVIPQTAVLQGTARSLTPQVRDLMRASHHRSGQVDGPAARRQRQGDLRAQISRDEEPCPQTEFAAGVAAQVAGMDKVNSNVAPVMGGEDFSFMLEARPGAFIFIGNGDSAGVHHPQYDFNDAAIPSGISYWARLAETAMPA